jgi:hypothetical protein
MVYLQTMKKGTHIIVSNAMSGGNNFRISQAVVLLFCVGFLSFMLRFVLAFERTE